MSQPLAFVIDDDASLGEAYRMAFEMYGFRAKHINDSTQALDRIIDEQPEVVMLDMMMPKMNGSEVLQAIRANEKTAHIQVIVATANHLLLDETISDLATLTLQKPVSLSQVAKLAQRLISATKT